MVHKEMLNTKYQSSNPSNPSTQMDSTSLFLWFQLVTHGVGPVLIPWDIIWIKLTKNWQRSTRRCYIPNIYALSVPVSEKKNFEVGFLCSYVPTCDPQGGASFDPLNIIWTNLVEVHKGMLKTKYQSSTPSSFRVEEFEEGILCSYFSTCDPWGGANLDPRSIIWTNLVEVN